MLEAGSTRAVLKPAGPAVAIGREARNCKGGIVTLPGDGSREAKIEFASGRWGPKPLLVFAHRHDHLSKIREGRAFRYFGRISWLLPKTTPPRRPCEPAASTL